MFEKIDLHYQIITANGNSVHFCDFFRCVLFNMWMTKAATTITITKLIRIIILTPTQQHILFFFSTITNILHCTSTITIKTKIMIKSRKRKTKGKTKIIFLCISQVVVGCIQQRPSPFLLFPQRHTINTRHSSLAHTHTIHSQLI